MKKRVSVLFFNFLLLSFCIYSDEADFVTIAILAKDKAHTLPWYLPCIESQTFPKNRTYLYIKTNNNNDNTAEILKNWVQRVGHLYAGIYFDDADLEENIQQYSQHEWNYTRFKILAKIRNDSVVWAHNHHSHYFVVDCDNFIKPHTLEALVKLRLPIVGPFMALPGSYYSNFHAAIDSAGYLASSDLSNMIYDQVVKGIIQVPVVHCCYLIQYECLPYVTYEDNSARYEYVIFSDVARRNNVTQYLDNRDLYGYITFAETQEEFEKTWWVPQVESWFKK